MSRASKELHRWRGRGNACWRRQPQGPCAKKNSPENTSRHVLLKLRHFNIRTNAASMIGALASRDGLGDSSARNPFTISTRLLVRSWDLPLRHALCGLRSYLLSMRAARSCGPSVRKVGTSVRSISERSQLGRTRTEPVSVSSKGPFGSVSCASASHQASSGEGCGIESWLRRLSAATPDQVSAACSKSFREKASKPSRLLASKMCACNSVVLSRVCPSECLHKTCAAPQRRQESFL